jgi:hypothetical protein
LHTGFTSRPERRPDLALLMDGLLDDARYFRKANLSGVDAKARKRTEFFNPRGHNLTSLRSGRLSFATHA